MMSVEYVPESAYGLIYDEGLIRAAAEKIHQSCALIIMAGAGMGAESGIGTYRTNPNFWEAHPQLREETRGIAEMSNSDLFKKDPCLAWGFIASRLQNYRNSTPHEGYAILKRWADTMDSGYFVFTSNVDRHFLRAGFASDRVVECHGSLEYLQCLEKDVSSLVWKTPLDLCIQWDPETLRAKPPLPSLPCKSAESVVSNSEEVYSYIKGDLHVKEEVPDIVSECPHCETNHPARPNMRLFNDDQWINGHIQCMKKNFHSFIENTLVKEKKNFVIIEVGVGLTVDTVRPTTDRIINKYPELSTLIRINPIEPEIKGDDNHISLRMTGLHALKAINKFIEQKKTLLGK